MKTLHGLSNWSMFYICRINSRAEKLLVHTRELSSKYLTCLISWSILGVLGVLGVQGWRSGDSTRLPPMLPGFDSQTRRHMWVEFVGSLLCTERFSPGTPVSPLLKNQHLT